MASGWLFLLCLKALKVGNSLDSDHRASEAPAWPVLLSFQGFGNRLAEDQTRMSSQR